MSSLKPEFRALALVLACVGVSVGCPDIGTDGDPDGSLDGSVDAGARDAFVMPFDAGTPCTMDVDCNDRVSCTRDVCDRGFCRNTIDLASCDDGVFCNGVEQCDLRRGCVPGPPETCNDEDVCTIDRCDEEHKTCNHSPRDFDEDGEADWHCPGGTDCDDRNPARASTVAEVCTDSLDNDCDDMVDESTCGGPPHDTCDDPLDVSAGGSFTVSTTGAVANYRLTCGGAGWRDVVLRFHLDEPKNVHIRAQADTTITAIGLRDTCGGATDALECASGYPADLRRRALPAGDYFVIVTSLSPDEVAVDVDITAATEPAANETCASPVDVSAGGRFNGSFVDGVNDLTTRCGGGALPDLVYSLTLTEPKDVTIAATATTGESLNFSVQRTCGTDASSVRCTSGSPATTVLHQLEAGTYFIVVEGPSYREVDFTLDVTFAAPTPPADGDVCSNAIPLTLGMRTAGTLENREDDLAASCVSSYKDVVYRFDVAAESDVRVVVDAPGRFVALSLRTDCGMVATERQCVTGTTARSLIRHASPGTYYAIVEASVATTFNITATAVPPVVPEAVTGNERCAVAHVIPETGGLFTGSTVTAIADYTAACGSMARSRDVVFSLTLTARKRVVASTAGSTFDTVLYMYTGACATGPETVCDDDGAGSSASLIDRTLEAGTYYYVVDGFGDSAAGDYSLEVLVSDP